MFYSTVLTLRALNNARIDYYIGKKVHGWFFAVLKEVDELLSDSLHANITDKAFTVSSFIGLDVSKPVQVEEGKKYRIRLTFLDDHVFDVFSSQLFESTLLERVMRLEDAQFVVDSFKLDHDSPWSGYASEEDLLRKASMEKVVTMKFYTPTSFRIGDLHLREPAPDKVFTSLLNKWNKYATKKFDENLREKFKGIQILKNDTIQKRVYFKDFYIQGFVGAVTFNIPETPSLVEAVNVLSEFAFFSGVGYKTTMGLGQARRIEFEEGKATSGG